MTVRLARLLPALLLLTTACLDAGKDDDDEDDDDEEEPSEESDSTDPEEGAAGGEYGPDNVWPHASADQVPDDLEGTGWYAGDTAYNFTLRDQNGDEVELYQFYGRLVLLDVFAVWCGPCNQLAPEGEEIWAELEDQGVVVLALTQEDASGGAPTADTAAEWAATHGLTHPVLADSDASQGEYARIGGGFPTFPVIGPDMTILTNDLYPPSVADVEALLEDVTLEY